MIHIRMRDHAGFESERSLKSPESPSQETIHVVAFTRIDDQRFILGRHNQCAVALADVHEHDLQQTLALQVLARDPTIGAAHSHLHQAITLIRDNLDPVTPKQLFDLFSTSPLRIEWCGGITRVADFVSVEGGFVGHVGCAHASRAFDLSRHIRGEKKSGCDGFVGSRRELRTRSYRVAPAHRQSTRKSSSARYATGAVPVGRSVLRVRISVSPLGATKLPQSSEVG